MKLCIQICQWHKSYFKSTCFAFNVCQKFETGLRQYGSGYGFQSFSRLVSLLDCSVGSQENSTSLAEVVIFFFHFHNCSSCVYNCIELKGLYNLSLQFKYKISPMFIFHFLFCIHLTHNSVSRKLLGYLIRLDYSKSIFKHRTLLPYLNIRRVGSIQDSWAKLRCSRGFA